jgi:transposase-like protein
MSHIYCSKHGLPIIDSAGCEICKSETPSVSANVFQDRLSVLDDEQHLICPECGQKGTHTGTHNGTQQVRGIDTYDVDIDSYKCTACGCQWSD